MPDFLNRHPRIFQTFNKRNLRKVFIGIAAAAAGIALRGKQPFLFIILYGWIISNRRRIIKWFRKKEILEERPDLDVVIRSTDLSVPENAYQFYKELTILSSLFARDCKNIDGAQLINVSSCGGYTIVPTAMTYCAAKFYVGAFTEGLVDRERFCFRLADPLLPYAGSSSHNQQRM